jgi:hypothetical protein
MKAEGNFMSAARMSRILRVGSSNNSPLPFLLDTRSASKALASRFSSRAPVAVRLKNKLDMNDTFIDASADAAPPERIVTNWRRFSSGLWRVPKGDISAAYCAEIFPKVRVFTHEGRVYTNCGGHCCGWIHEEKNCHRLIPVDEYRGPEPSQYTYEGREATYKGNIFRLGAKVIFVSSDPSVDEWRRLVRVLYADGGMFASHCTYLEFLDQRFKPESENGQTARLRELAEGNGRLMPRTREEMRRLLEGKICDRPQQAEFAL